MGIFSPNTITDFVRTGDLDGVRRRLELGDNVNERRSFSTTPLLEAARLGYWAILELLLDHGADLELVDFNNFTALHQAIDNKRVDAALLLARRGACANKIGYFGRTPLQSAIKRNLLQVTAELLTRGADPLIRDTSGTIAKDYIQEGPNREEFENLLDAYKNLDLAIQLRNGPAIAACLDKSLFGEASVPISSIEAAIQLKHMEAVKVILELALTNETLETNILHQNVVEAAIASGENSDFHENLRHIGENFMNNLLEKVLVSQDIAILKQLIEGVENTASIHERRLSNGWTALHYAVSLDNYSFVYYLLVDCGLNPLVTSSDDKTAHDVALATNGNSAICLLLIQHTKKMVFSDQTTVLMCTQELTVEDLRGLIGQITSVNDLRIIISLGFQSLDKREMHSVLTEAFNEIIREKLVFDDRAAVFFKVGLKECKRQNYISEVELIEWDLKATKVNVENADWVRDIKQSLHAVEGRITACERSGEVLHTQFTRLRDALIQREKYAIRQQERQRYISLLSSALMMCGGSVFQELFGAAFDLWDPVQLLSTLSADDVAEFLAEQTSTLVFKDCVEAILTDASVNPGEFAVLLRDAAKCDYKETVEAESLFSPPSSCTINAEIVEAETLFPPLPDVQNASCTSPLIKKRNLRFRSVVHDMLHRVKSEEGRDVTAVECLPHTSSIQNLENDSYSLNGMTEEDMEAFPYHYAVKFSDGDIERFREMVQYIDKDDGDINETLTIYVRPNGSMSEWEEVAGSALIYASYLGYVDIVKWFLEHDAIQVTEKRFSTMKRSHSSSKNINDVCIKNPVICA